MIGVLFTMPQFFQAVRGTDAMGSGIRLLPMVGGLILGAVPADGIARLIGAKITTALGFVLLSAATALGARTGVGSSEAFIATWMALFASKSGWRWRPRPPPRWSRCRSSAPASAPR